MKKILALVFALILAFSACSVAFAAAEFACESCHAVLADQKALDAHNNGGCLVQFKACQYCGSKIEAAYIELHEGECPKGAADCDYCGKKALANQNALEAHQASADCAKKCDKCGVEVTCAGKDDHKCAVEDQIKNPSTWEKLAEKVVELLGKVDWKGLADKVVTAVKGIDFDGIVAKIKPIFEKVVDVFENVELPEIPAAK